jgi:hypothetical protein
MKATMQLVPQFEGSIRRLLHLRGHPTSKVRDGLQEELDVFELLYRCAPVEELLTPDLVLCLKSLLAERFGGNLRNKVAHALMSDAEFFGPDAIYAWWLMLHLCVVFRLGVERGRGEEASQGATVGERQFGGG